MNTEIYMNLFSTAAGWVGASWSEAGLIGCTLPGETRDAVLGSLLADMPPALASLFPVFDERGLGKRVAAEFSLYFRQELREFTLPVDWSYSTDFQKRVLKAVQGIPCGSVCSYQQVAVMVGMPRAARAVGGALGSNRISLVIPCHRVIRQDGGPGGFGSSLEWKAKLLALEGRLPDERGKYVVNWT